MSYWYYSTALAGAAMLVPGRRHSVGKDAASDAMHALNRISGGTPMGIFSEYDRR